MTGRVRALLFLLGATLFNLLATALLFFGLLFLYSVSLGRFLAVKSSGFLIVAAFLLAVLGAGFAYRRLLDRLLARPDFAARFGLDPGSVPSSRGKGRARGKARD